MSGLPALSPRRNIWIWLFIASAMLIAAARIFEVLEPPAIWILLTASMGLMIPAVKTARRQQEARGAMSPALRSYNTRVALFGAIYMVCMIAGVNLVHVLPEGSPLLWLVAIAPLLPTLGIVWAMFRYLTEEDDEYLRHRAVNGALTGIGLVLVLGTGWGFLEMFGLAPHVWNWWVFPIFSVGLGLGMCNSWSRGA